MWEDAANEQSLKVENQDDQATYYPKGELVIIEKDHYAENTMPTLAYKFDIYATDPVSRSDYYIDASSGGIILEDPIIKHVSGTAQTKYSGTRTISTESIDGGQFRLRDISSGNGIYTFNIQHSTNTNNAIDVIDNDNYWSAAEYDNANMDNVALDAHWGATKTYDYFNNVHDRNSIDDNGFLLKNYVHYDVEYDNAAWTGNEMVYGDGGPGFLQNGPWVSIDIIGHEIAHGFDQFTSNLINERESGALDEGLADIWGAVVEFYAAPEKNTYVIGEDNWYSLRSMSNPKSKSDPDTYGGDFWEEPECGTPTGGGSGNDRCGIHTNCTIIGHWFYLLAEGSANTDEINDNNQVFSVDAIGKSKAAKIVYRAQTKYFKRYSKFIDARNFTIEAAVDLYGENSFEVINTTNAWHAVGVGSKYICTNTIISNMVYSSNSTINACDLQMQNVTIQNNSNMNVNINGGGDLIINGSFEASQGVTLNIINQ